MLGSKITPQLISQQDFDQFYHEAYPTTSPSPENVKRKLGEILTSKGVINQQELAWALNLQKRSGERLGQILISFGHVNRLVLSETIAEQVGLEHINLRKQSADPDVVKMLNADTCRTLGCIPVRIVQNTLDVVVVRSLEYFPNSPGGHTNSFGRDPISGDQRVRYRMDDTRDLS